MSQRLVFQLLAELGGSATIGEIRKLAHKRYPDASLYSYVGQQLKKLSRKGYVRFDETTQKWHVVPGDSPE